MLFFFPNSMKKTPMGSEGFFSQSLNQVIHHSALSKELSTTWDEQWHCDCRDRRARDWKISAICWASQRRPKVREGGLKVEEEEGLERLADEIQKILTLWHGCQKSCLRNSCSLQIWINSREEREREREEEKERVGVERKRFQIRRRVPRPWKPSWTPHGPMPASEIRRTECNLPSRLEANVEPQKKKDQWCSFFYYFTPSEVN